MTVNVARRSRRRAATPAAPEYLAPTEAIAIGEIDQTVFDCPSCARPLALGARRCPGCRTRLVRGVALSKASGFIAAGLAVGLALGGGSGFLLASARGGTAGGAGNGGTGAPVAGGAGTGSPAPTTTATTQPTAIPSAPGETPSAPATGGEVPASVRAALVQVVATNDRLAAGRASLVTELTTRPFDASAVAQTLRSISADTVFATDLAGRLSGWAEADTLATELATFYGSVHTAAAAGLVASVRNEAAYRASAQSLVRILGAIPGIDAAVRTSAANAGLTLPSASSAPSAP